MKIEKYSFGMGDRFERESEAQLQAVIQAKRLGIELTPVWNKSNREHAIVKSEPRSLRRQVDDAVAALGWTGPYRVDADHINFETVDRFIEASDFYTIDVADYTGKMTGEAEIEEFCQAGRKYLGPLSLPGLAGSFVVDPAMVKNAAEKFLGAMQEAARVARKITKLKGENVVIEVSIDETDTPQTPVDLLLILFMLAREKVACQTIAPKFVGRFNKGIDYVGDLVRFEREFEENLCAVRFAIREFGLPETLKLSVHSGSDKFSIYPIINRLLKKHSAGVHVKTAGTTWLEEIIGLAEAGKEGLLLAQEIYAEAFARREELVGPYAAVVDIDPSRLPRPEDVRRWSSAQYCATLRHQLSAPEYNPDFRQLLHVSFKVAAEMGPRYLSALDGNRAVVARNVTENLLNRHIIPLFGQAS